MSEVGVTNAESSEAFGNNYYYCYYWTCCGVSSFLTAHQHNVGYAVWRIWGVMALAERMQAPFFHDFHGLGQIVERSAW